MKTHLIITFTIVAILFIIAYCKVGMTIKPEKFFWFFIYTVIASVSLFTTITLIIEINEMKEKLENKCPQYEEVHNLYKLK